VPEELLKEGRNALQAANGRIRLAKANAARLIEGLRSAGDMESQMRLLQTGPTVDTLLVVLTPSGKKIDPWGEGSGDLPLWEGETLETVTSLLTLVSDVLRADARMRDNILGRECGQLVAPLQEFIRCAGDDVVRIPTVGYEHGYPTRQRVVQVPATEHAAYLLTEVQRQMKLSCSKGLLQAALSL
jgi:hypothetical protein